MTTVPFKGIIPPLVTPLLERNRLDVEGLERLIEHVLAGGVHGLFVLGTTGEGPSLAHTLQRELVSRTVEQMRNRAPVLVGVTDTSMDESLHLCRHAADAGADAVVLAAPYYFPMHQDDLERFVRNFAVECPLPIMLYNMPSHTKVAFSVETVRRLLDIENVVGVKDSSAQMPYFQQLVDLARERAGFTVLMGPEELLGASVLMGGDGGVCGGANLFPSLYCELYDAALTGDLRRVMQLQQRVQRLSNKLYNVGPAPTNYLTGLKTSLALVGLCSDRLSEPLFQMSAGQSSQLAQHLRDLGLLVESTKS
ncbi:MAG: dihydrodipicolinate synthase family protein [Planctomycetaceae bacterium]